MTAILQEIIDLLIGGVSSMATGIGSGLNALVNSIFIDASNDTKKLTTFGGIVIVFAGVSLAIGLSRWVVNFLTSLGN